MAHYPKRLGSEDTPKKPLQITNTFGPETHKRIKENPENFVEQGTDEVE
jgi:hypothetical protein